MRFILFFNNIIMATQELSNELFNIKEKLTQEEYKNLYDSLSKVNEEVNKNKLVELTYMSILPKLDYQGNGEQTIDIQTQLKTMIVPLTSIHNSYEQVDDIEKLKKKYIGSGFRIGQNAENNFGRDIGDPLTIKFCCTTCDREHFTYHNGHCCGSDDCLRETSGYDCDDLEKNCIDTQIRYVKNIVIAIEQYVVIG